MANCDPKRLRFTLIINIIIFFLFDAHCCSHFSIPTFWIKRHHWSFTQKIIATEALVFQWSRQPLGGLGMYLLWMKECCFRYMPCLPSKSSPALPLLSHAPSLGRKICEEEVAMEAGSSESKKGDPHLPSGLQNKAERGEASKLRAFALEKKDWNTLLAPGRVTCVRGGTVSA